MHDTIVVGLVSLLIMRNMWNDASMRIINTFMT